LRALNHNQSCTNQRTKRKKMFQLFLKTSVAVVVAASAFGASAGAIRDAAFFNTNSLARNDDSSTGQVNLGFSANINGTSYTSVYVNNNGNITFTGPLSTYTPSGITSSSTPIIAPFWADVDTSNPTSSLVRYDSGTLNGARVFGVNWIDVGYYNSEADKLNSFQLILTDRGAGNFSIEFNYDRILWETGAASGGTNGFGGTPARVGYTIGTGAAVELTGSGVTRAFLDSGPNGTRLIGNSIGSSVLGRYIFNAEGGVIRPSEPPTGVPLPGSLALIGLGSIGMSLRQRTK
jgi:Nidogen-like/PEP-CTERM motif